MGKKPKYKLKVSSHFSSSHQLRNYRGKCENLHGHNFIVEVMIEGTKLDSEIEYLLDFKTLKQMLKQIIEPLDHIHLNDFPPFDKINPSSENLARYIYKEMEKQLSSFDDIYISYVAVAESEKSIAYYMEE